MTSKNSSTSKLHATSISAPDGEKESVHVTKKIQDHGVLLACTVKDKIVQHASENTKLLFDEEASEILGNSIYAVIDKSVIGEIFEQLQKRSLAYKEIVLNKQNVTVIAHKSNQLFVLEFETNTIVFNPFQYQIRLAETASEINNVSDVLEKCDCVASLIKKHLRYDRVMVYQFDAEWNGEIVAEQKEKHLESWLGLNFPASDIPQENRQLYLMQSAHIVNNVASEAINILSSNQNNAGPLDLSQSELKAISPVNKEYLTNMKVGAMLSTAIVHDNLLWGLIICHHYTPKYINYYQRLNSKFLAQILATSIHLNNTDEVLDKLKKNSLIRSNLIDQINIEKDIARGLSQYEFSINDLTNSHGAAIYINNKVTTVGYCPANTEIVIILEKIRLLTDTQLYHTRCFKHDFEEAAAYQSVASGVLCLFISVNNNDAIIWFKPEVVRTINWAGNPEKMTSNDGGQRRPPRKSFERWSVKQSGTSEPWEDHEISEGISLQKNIQDIIIANYDEARKLNDRLKMAYEELESFSYSISHDLRAPLRGIDGFAHILKEDYYDNLDEFGQSAVDTIITSVTKMNLLIDDILEYSGLGKRAIDYRQFSIKFLVQELLQDLKSLYTNVEVVIDNDLPNLLGDRTIVLLLIKNLLENAMKYSSKVEKPRVNIGCIDGNTFFIKDNGIGFDMKHKNKIFGVFERLVNDEYSGSGIGLAIAKRVVDKHNGEIWVQSQKDAGSTFYFRLGKK